MEQELIPGYPRGSDITLLNTIYLRPKKDENGKYGDDSITIIYRDNKSGIKRHHTIYNPSYTIYFANEDKVSSYPEFFKPVKDCNPVEVPYKDIEKEIASFTDNLDFFYDNIRTGNRYNNRRLHMEPEVLFSDVDIEDRYRFEFSQMYTNNTYKLSKSFCDIEVDGRYTINEFPYPGEVPVNAISYYSDKTNKLYSFLLRESKNPLCKQFEDSIIPTNFLKEAKEFIVDKVGGWKQATRFGIIDMGIELNFFDNEIDLIKSLFDLMHKVDEDFLLFWNASFDCTYLVERCKALGYDPAEIMSDKSYAEKVAYYYTDERNDSDFAERNDFARFGMNTVVLCQMIQFASRRKGRAAIDNFKLDNIGEMMAGVHKLSYSHITNKIEDLPYLDYKTFVLYNMMDVVVQKCIESKTGDIDYIFNKCLINNTRYNKGHRQTIYLVNRFAKEFMNLGFVIGNNCNKFNQKEGKFPGALVGKPKNTDDYAKVFVMGHAIMVANNLMDEDYKSLYPSITLENNIAPNTLIGIAKLDHKVYDGEDPYHNDKFSREAEMMEMYITGNNIIFAMRYLHLAGFMDAVEDMKEYMDKYNPYCLHGNLEPMSSDGIVNPVHFENKENGLDMIHFEEVCESINPIQFYNTLNEDYKKNIMKESRGQFYDKGRI